MIDPELLEKFYTKVFSVPRKRITVSIALVTIVIASYLNGTSSKIFFVERYFFVGLSILISLMLVSRFLVSAFNSRRLFFLALFFLIFTEFFDFLAVQTGNEEIIVVAPASSAFIISTVLFFTSKRFSFFAPLAILLLVYPAAFLFSYQANHRFLAYLITSLAGIGMSFLFLKYLDKKFGRVEILPLLKKFLWYWLTNEEDELEREFEKYSKEFEGKYAKVKIGDVVLHAANVHPGPLRNLGGSKLVKKVMTKKKNVFLHAASMHSENPISVKELEKLVDKENYEEVKAKKPYRIEGKRFWVKVYPFSDFSLVIVHGKNYMDDLPFELQAVAEKVYGNCVLIDSHSCYGKELGVEDILEIEELFKAKESEEAELSYHYDELFVETESICSKVAVLLLNYSGEKHAIVVFDSNNVSCHVRNEVLKIFEERGYDADVLSTDNHEKTGVSPRKSYKAVGEEEKFLLEFFKKVLEEASFEKAHPQVMVEKFRVKVMGREFFEDLERAFKEIGEKAMYLFFFLMFLNPLLAYVLARIII
ncbi:Protein of unknown function DUF2070, membrane [Ferroglobus placidus DSM 10642]|uniref:DUF2070 domain-containing protein n=1 Tax=Ferroglobus placidus (strain DSM 10642 / AEDII12DO) TaxID=589924 RepID=D3RYE6_FERPA|nr:DUF2070 family protein [Ferroglobus placidus]ADC65509.1 Protein of unknown function DUF2070, membrane [Ferroglobus placidus DSM 10642]